MGNASKSQTWKTSVPAKTLTSVLERGFIQLTEAVTSHGRSIRFLLWAKEAQIVSQEAEAAGAFISPIC